jgi:hypothetical protein
MRVRVAGLLLLAAALALLPSRGQERPAQPGPADDGARAASFTAPVGPGPAAARPGATPTFAGLDFAKLPRLQQHFALSAGRAADWLARLNGVKGRFLHGWRPDLAVEIEGDHFLRQAGAAYALARAARLSGSEAYAARATQALILLFDQTEHDPQTDSRWPSLPSVFVSRLGGAGLLLAAVHELPDPPKDLLGKGEQLARFIAGRARPDGSLRCGDAPDSGPDSAEERAAAQEAPGLAVYGVLRSQARRPAAWKLVLAHNALAYYPPLWRKERSVAGATWQIAAWAEAYALTREQAYADAAFETADWLCGLQYDHVAPQRAAWQGGFMGFEGGRKVEALPDAGSAACAEALARACRATRLRGDLERHRRYTAALESALQFLGTLQYTEATTQHFADWYRPRLVGGFYASSQDGSLRIDHTQHALCALLLYLEHVAR